MWRLQVEPTIDRQNPEPMPRPPSTGTGRSGSPELALTRMSMPMWRAATPTWACARAPSVPISSTTIGNRTHSAEASCKYDNGEFDKTGSLIHRFGTLNGIATASHAVCTSPAATYSRTTQVAIFVRRPARAACLAPRRPGLRAALRRDLRARGHTCRRQQERQRVSPHRHQHRGTATGAARCESPDPASRTTSRAREWSNTNGAAAI